MFVCLYRLGLTVSYSATLLLLDKLGSKYDENVIAWRAAQVETREEEMVML